MDHIKRGVLVGSNEALEWLLPWWWKNYSAHNTLPVAFADFGMSSEGRHWCENKGRVISIDPVEDKIFTSKHKEWADVYGSSYEIARQGWFKKPFALSKTPFDITLWCDLDCEVLKSLSDLFALAPKGPFIALVTELSNYDHPYTIYNGGVILYEKTTPIIAQFSREVFLKAKDFWGDDRLLSYLIHEGKYPVIQLPDVFNWRIGQGVPADAYILHWTGEWGKKYIQKLGGLAPFLKDSEKSVF